MLIKKYVEVGMNARFHVVTVRVLYSLSDRSLKAGKEEFTYRGTGRDRGAEGDSDTEKKACQKTGESLTQRGSGRKTRRD